MQVQATALLILCLGGCSARAVPARPLPVADPSPALVVGGREVDVLAVVDNSASPIDPEQYLPGYHALFRRLLVDSGCGSANLDRCRVADTRVGVITSDLGAGPLVHGNCVPGGDGARLQDEPCIPGCTPPRQAWLSYAKGEVNVPETGADAFSRFLQGFDCIANVKLGRCGFEHHLEAVRRALDPALRVNPGYLRDTALLVVAVAADEDDCSAARTELFSSQKTGIDDELGPLTSFRCVEFGLECDEPLRPVGAKHSCRPAQDWLVPVGEYVRFLRALRPGRVLFFSLGGPPSPLVVGRDGVQPAVHASCNSVAGAADPGIRLKAVADALGPQGLFNPAGTDACTPLLAPAFEILGQTILEHLESQCLPAPLVTAAGGLVCSAGEEVAPGVTCSAGCLELADCVVEDVTTGSSASPRPVPRCPANLAGTDCAASCPCWRLLRMPELCAPQQTGSPHALQVLRKTGLLAPSGTHAVATCRTTSAAWGSESFATALQCQ